MISWSAPPPETRHRVPGTQIINRRRYYETHYTVYRFIDSSSVAACLTWIDGEYFCDSYNFRAAIRHHDGTNYVTYRALKMGVTRRLQDRIWDCQIAGKTLTKSDISKYTTSLQPQIADVYGWPQFKPRSKKHGKKISAA